MTAQKYSFITGIMKTAKNSAVLLGPFFLAILAGIDVEYAWITGPLAYLIKNWYDNRTQK